VSSTLLTHKGCKGIVALNANKLCYLIAPSFVVSTSGITNMVVDIITNLEKKEPEYICCKCYETFSGESLKTKVCVSCLVCGESEEVGSAFIHSALSCVCSSCTKKLKESFVEPDEASDLIKQYVNVFGLTKTFRVSSLYKALSIPVKL
jgi:hypothetical protein